MQLILLKLLLCTDVQSLPRFEILLGPICNLCPDLKSLCPDLKSLSSFVIFLPRFEILKAAAFVIPLTPICNPFIVPFCNPENFFPFFRFSHFSTGI